MRTCLIRRDYRRGDVEVPCRPRGRVYEKWVGKFIFLPSRRGTCEAWAQCSNDAARADGIGEGRCLGALPGIRHRCRAIGQLGRGKLSPQAEYGTGVGAEGGKLEGRVVVVSSEASAAAVRGHGDGQEGRTVIRDSIARRACGDVCIGRDSKMHVVGQ